VEEALKIKEAKGEGEVIVLSLGPDRALEAIRTALAMGADRAVHLKDPAFDGSDTLGTAKALAKALGTLEYDLILAGKQAVDSDDASVPSMLAQLLDLPEITNVSKLEILDGKIMAYSDIEGGAKMVIEAPTPAVVAAAKGLNEPRYASLPGIMKAKRKEVKEMTAADLGLDASEVGAAGSKIKIAGWSMPEERAAGRVLEGELEDTVKELAKLLREEAKVI